MQKSVDNNATAKVLNILIYIIAALDKELKRISLSQDRTSKASKAVM